MRFSESSSIPLVAETMGTPAGNRGRQVSVGATTELGGHCDDDELGACHGGRQVRLGPQRLGQRCSGQEEGVLVDSLMARAASASRSQIA